MEPKMPKENELEDGIILLADTIYTAYCGAVGGVAFNGDPLPNWEAFYADPAKAKQSNAWVEAAKAAFDLIFEDADQIEGEQIA